MKTHVATLDQIPMENDVVTVVTRAGEPVTGPLIRMYYGVRPGRIRGSVRTGPSKDDFAAGLIGIYYDE